MAIKLDLNMLPGGPIWRWQFDGFVDENSKYLMSYRLTGLVGDWLIEREESPIIVVTNNFTKDSSRPTTGYIIFNDINNATLFKLTWL